MKIRSLLCGGALGIALCVGVAAPAWPQYSRESTPEERAQTRELNRDAVNGRVVRPTPQEARAYENARAQYESDEARYQRELDEYNARMRDFDRQRQNYDQGPYEGPPDRDEDRYEDRGDPNYGDQSPDPRYDDRDNDDRRGGGDPYDPPLAADDPPGQLVPLDRFANPSDELFNTPVVDADGFSVGHFRRVETRDDGAVMAVITLNAMRTISVPVQEIFFDPANQVIVSPRITVNGFDAIPSGVLLGSYED